jgi:hypothetical protein
LDDAGEHTAGVQQVGYGAERCRCNCLTRRGGTQVGPGGWDERAGPVGQNQDEVQLAVAPHPAKQRECLAFQRVAGSNNGDLGRVALEVGSVLPFRSTTLHALIALHGLETAITAAFQHDDRPHVVVYADDFVVLHPTRAGVERARRIAEAWLSGIGLQLKASQTRIGHTLHSIDGRIGFDFLGFSIRH